MDFINKIRDLQSHVKKQIEHKIVTEQATKAVLVEPFIKDVLGYDTRNIAEVVPEDNADIGGSKADRVDYTILKDGDPIILIECKKYGTDLDKEHIPQLAKYFTFINAEEIKYPEETKFAILTNGIIYRFYTDLVKTHVLDKEPFLDFNILTIKDSVIAELRNFSNPLDPTIVTKRPLILKYIRDLRQLIDKEFNDPSEKFVRFFASQVHHGNVNDNVVDQFTKLTKKVLDEYITDKINDRLAIVIHPLEPNGGTTKEELEAYYIIKTILTDVVDQDQIIAANSENSLDIIYDDDGGSQKVICRLYLNDGPKYLGLFDKNGNETKTAIDSIDDIQGYSDQIISVIGPTVKPSFIFEGKKYELDHWKDMLPKVCAIMTERHKDDFEKMLEIRGRKHNYFSKNPEEFKWCEKIVGTEIYVNTNAGQYDQLNRSRKVLAKFGLPKDSIQLEN